MIPAMLQRITSLAARERELLARVAGGDTEYPAQVGDQSEQLAALRAGALALQAAGVPHALIGGVAVGLRSGVPRATEDVDFAVPTDANWERLAAELAAQGFVLRGSFEHSRNFVHPSGEPVQFAFDPAFDPMIARAESIDMDGFALSVVTTEDLIAMKKRAASDPRRRRSKALRDAADVALLEGDRPDPDEGW